MTPSLACPLALSSLVLLAACATSSAAPIAADASPLAGIDLGPSSRIPTTRIATVATGHEAHRTTAAHRTAAAAAGRAQPVPAINNDARATGTINAIDPADRTINLDHDPIPVLGWPAMTMKFAVAPSVDLNAAKPGSRVAFSLRKGKTGFYEVQSLQPAGGGR
jgi:Cu/Ag efflux protein CusF